MSIMTLAFPILPEVSMKRRKRVLFFGHDGVFKTRFFVEASALAKWGTAVLTSGMSEAKCLSLFDPVRTSILDVPREAYSPRGRNC
jgi:hypothetical protein